MSIFRQKVLPHSFRSTDAACRTRYRSIAGVAADRTSQAYHQEFTLPPSVDARGKASMNWDRLLTLLKDPRVRARLLRASRAILIDNGHAEDALHEAELDVVVHFQGPRAPTDMTSDQILNYLAVAVRNRARDKRRALSVPGRALAASVPGHESPNANAERSPEPPDPIRDAKVRSAWHHFPRHMQRVFVGPGVEDQTRERGSLSNPVKQCDKNEAREYFRKLLAHEEQVPFSHVVRAYWDRLGALLVEKRAAQTIGHHEPDPLEEWTYVCLLLYAWGRSWSELARIPIKFQIDAPLRWICGLIKPELRFLERYRSTAEQFYPLVRDMEDPEDDGC